MLQEISEPCYWAACTFLSRRHGQQDEVPLFFHPPHPRPQPSYPCYLIKAVT